MGWVLFLFLVQEYHHHVLWCGSDDDDDDDVVNNEEGHRKHITKVLQIAGMVGGSEKRKDALLTRTNLRLQNTQE